MFILKKKYFLIIESIKDLDLKNIKKHNKFNIIYRNKKKNENIADLLIFRKSCNLKSIKFFVANDLSAFNKSLKTLSLRKSNFEIIGSAHSLKEISTKIKQGCNLILFSKLFVVNYDKKAPFMGIIKFNNLLRLNKNLIPLGGINENNLNSLNIINSTGLALMSEIKKKPTKIFSRLF